MVEALMVGAGVFVVMFVFIASLASIEETSERRKNYEAGTHDYYGNKL